MTEADIKRRLTTRRLGRELVVLESVDSTNAYARNLAGGTFVDGTLVIADRQTAGRGRMGRAWTSSAGKDLTFSVILRPPVPTERMGLVSLASGLAVAEAIRSTTGLPALCKWPNDVLLGSRKCCGILSEGVLEGGRTRSVVIGIGINVNETAFDGGLNATSLALEARREFDRFVILNAVLEQMERRIGQLETGDAAGMLGDWRRLNCMLGRNVTVEQTGTLHRGLARDIADDGGLVVAVDGRTMKFLAGDVHILP